MRRLTLIIFSAFLLFSACALEIANVIGPGGGYVFYDKGNYDGKWRYMECSPFDIGELEDVNDDAIRNAMKLCKDHSGGWYTFEWELPDEAQLKKMLECFSYGLTRFSPDYYYLAVNRLPGYDQDNPNEESDPGNWKAVVLHKNFDNKLNGEVERVETFPDVVRIRPIRKF